MLTASSFRLEFRVDKTKQQPKVLWNLSINEVPPIMAQCGVELKEWRKFYRHATGVAESAVQHQHEENNDGANNNEATENKKAVEKGWKQLLSRLSMMYHLGITVSLIRHPKTNEVYGLEFRSDDESKHKKAIFRYDYRASSWNYDRDTPPIQLKGKLSPEEWTILYDRGQSVVENQLARQKEQEERRSDTIQEASNNYNADGPDTPDTQQRDIQRQQQSFIIDIAKRLQEEAFSHKLNEMEWKQFESLAKDMLFPHIRPGNTIQVSLLANDSMTREAPFLYSGLEFRIK